MGNPLSKGQAAKEWWRRVLAENRFDNGEPSHGALASMLAQTRDPVKVEKLLDLIAEWADKTDSGYLDIDYSPCGALAQLIETVGLDSSGVDWPWKTTMFVGDRIMGWRGYGAREEQIWPVNV